MRDKDSDVIINPRVYKAAIEAAKINNQHISEFLEEAINNQIEISEERKQLSILEKELEVINRRTKIVRDKAYERLNKVEEELDSYKQKYEESSSNLKELKEKNKKTEEELKEKSKNLDSTEKALEETTLKYEGSSLRLNKIEEEHEKLKDNFKAKVEKLKVIKNTLDLLKEKYAKVSTELNAIKDDYNKIKDELKERSDNLKITDNDLYSYKEKFHETSIKLDELREKYKKTTAKLKEKEENINKIREEFKGLEEDYKDYTKKHGSNLKLDDKALKQLLLRIKKEKEEAENYKYKYEELIDNFKRKYQFLSQNTPVGVLIFQSKKVVFANDYFYNMLGYSKDELKDVYKVLIKTSQKLLKKQLSSEEERSDFELEARTKNRKKLYLEVRMTKVLYNKKPSLILILRDISHRKDLSESEETIEDLRYSLKDKVYEIESLKKLVAEKSKAIDEFKKQTERVTKEKVSEIEGLKKEHEKATKEKSKEIEELKKQHKEEPKGVPKEEPEELPKEVPKELPEIKEEKPVIKEAPVELNANALVILTDEEGNISSLNNQVTSELGYKLADFFNEEENAPKGIEELMADEKERENLKKWIKETALSRTPLVKKVVLKDKQGRSKKFTLVMELIRDIDAEPVGIISIFF
ncbi:MAG: PAS domain-containing protein [Candidatus Woesearchaeota archaeon]|nr:MAG: PAS domain-containing protein [Candidatus Woesearchaeota archaeon]